MFLILRRPEGFLGLQQLSILTFKGPAQDQDPALYQTHNYLPLSASHEEILKTFESLYLEIEERIPPQQEIYFLGSDQDWLRGKEFGLEKRPCVFLPAEAAPTELKNAWTQCENRLQRKLEELKEDYPEIPWSSNLEAAKHITILQRASLRKFYDLGNVQVAEWMNEVLRKKKMLLHVCCGPDAAGVIHQLKEKYDLTCFWYDPNIQPKQEHDKRLDAFVKVAEIEKVPYIIGEYDLDSFYKSIQGLEATPEQGAKCSKCYDMRLERAAVEARNKGFDFYATTLAISPHKVQKKLIAFGELNEARYGVPYYHRNFMKSDGFKRSLELTEEYQIYRQDYCGCYFSLHEGGTAAQWLAQKSEITPETPIEERPENISSEIFNEYERQTSLTQSSTDPNSFRG